MSLNLRGPSSVALSATYAPRDYGYLLACFRGNSADQQSLNVYYSGDGKSFLDPGVNPILAPSDGSVVRDPSIIYKDGYFYETHTRTPATGTSFDVYRSADLVTWTKQATVDCSSIGSVNSTWAPELAVDDNGDVYVFVSINATSVYRLKASDAALTTWGAPILLTFTGGPAQIIDAAFVKRGPTWYCFYKNETAGGKTIERATASSLTATTWVVDKTGDWAGWGVGVEGPSIVQLPSGTYRMYVDRYLANTGTAYAESADLTTWSALTTSPALPAMGNSDLLRHGSVIRLRDQAAFAAVAALISSRRVKHTAAIPNAQGSAAGVYFGKNGTAAGVELSDGANTIRLENDGTGLFRILKAGVQSNFQMSISGQGRIRGGFGVYDATTAPTSKPTITGSRGGNAALASLLTTLALSGHFIDGTSA